MFYICKKKETKLGIRYGVMDTEDGVVEYYSPRDIIDFVRIHGLHIEGVSINRDAGKWQFKVLQPTAFAEAETSSYTADHNNIKGSASVSEISYKQSEDTIEVSYPKEWGMLAGLAMEQIKEIFKSWKAYLDDIICRLRITQPESLDFIDGLDCVGYEKLAIPNTPYFMSIYTNPAYDSEFYTPVSVEVGKVLFHGIGVDIMGLSGKSWSECHFDSEICSDFVIKFIEWLNNLADDVCLLKVTNFINLCRYAEKLLPRCKLLNSVVSLQYNDGDTTILEGGLLELKNFDFSIISEDVCITSWFASSADCVTNCSAIGYLYIGYKPSKGEYSLYGVQLHETVIHAFESAGFPRGEFQKQCSASSYYYEVKGTYEEMRKYIDSLLSLPKSVLTQDSDSLKHFIELAKKVNSKFTDLFRNNTLGIEMSQLLDISIMINGDNCFNLLTEPKFSVSCPQGYSFTKFVASLRNGEGYLMFGFDGSEYSVFVDACEPDKFGFYQTDCVLFKGTEKELLCWLNSILLLADNSNIMSKFKDVVSTYRKKCLVNKPQFPAELCEFAYGNKRNEEQSLGYSRKGMNIGKPVFVFVDDDTYIMANAYCIVDASNDVIADVWLDYYLNKDAFMFRFVNQLKDAPTSHIISSIDNKLLSYNEMIKVLNKY